MLLCLPCFQGELEIGETVVPMYVDQSRDALDPNRTVRMDVLFVAVEVHEVSTDVLDPNRMIMKPWNRGSLCESASAERGQLCNLSGSLKQGCADPDGMMEESLVQSWLKIRGSCALTLAVNTEGLEPKQDNRKNVQE
eukprot:scaffold101863_cov21-Tisochrysis_lutea.AAC.1